MQDKDIILSIDVVEPGLVKAVKLLSKELGRPLKGIALVHKSFLDYPGRPVDKTGLFEEIVVDYDDKHELQRTIKPFVDRILVVTTRYEDAIHHFSSLVPFIPYVNAPSESSLIWSTEKPMMRDRLKAHDENLVPKYCYLEEKELPNLKELVYGFTYPVIVKPGSLWSSFLVSECKSEKELESYLRKTFKVIRSVYDRVRRETEPVILVEEMMQGEMYSTDAYVAHDGTIECLPIIRVLTANEVGLTGFYGYSCIVPTGLSIEEEQKAFDAAKSAIRALHLRSTTAHVELFRTKQGWKIIELGARIGGYREGLYGEAFGIEHHYNDLVNRAGLKTKINRKHIKHARAENIFADMEGVVEAIEGIEEAKKLESTVFVEKHANVGDEALFAHNGGDLLVDAILSNENKEKLEQDVTMLRKLVKIKIKKISKPNKQ
jgi:D-alanine-D-alanine ligase-like ATP-grasp enzyme